METFSTVLVDVAIILMILFGVQQFRTPHGAIRGNFTAALALGLAIVLVVLRNGVHSPLLVFGLLAVGGGFGWWLAKRVTMIQTPAMVALQHGAGAVAAFLVCVIELVRLASPDVTIEDVSGLVGLALGAATFSASLMAAGKLANKLKQAPTALAGHNLWLLLVLAGILVASVIAATAATAAAVVPLLLGIIVLAAALGLLVAVRVGGADMPVLISFLNATAGLAAAFAGVVIGNRLLVAAGATVAASGSVLTIAMVQAMNRSLLAVFRGFKPAPASASAKVAPAGMAGATQDGGAVPVATSAALDTPAVETPAAPAAPPVDPMTAARDACNSATSVIIIPGYGMAMAQAQFEVVELARLLETKGAKVRFAIHPVAGRMPGHMHVLLSEADAPWDQLFEMPHINGDFADTDLALVVGASDVVNPAANEAEGTPISGMPILKAYEARQVIVVNLDEKPGYSGVPNTLYDRPQSILLWGDAKDTIRKLIDHVGAAPG